MNTRGFLSDLSLQENEFEKLKRARVAEGHTLLDLTETNLTRVGLRFPEEILIDGARRYLSNRCYTPDPKGLLVAREAIARYYQEAAPELDIDARHVFVTASTSEAYSLLFSLLGEPGDSVLTPSITYPLFELLAQHHRLECREYLLEEENNWAISESDLSKTIAEASGPATDGSTGSVAAALLISPHNPTGAIQSRAIEVLAQSKLPIISDEVFGEFRFDGSVFRPLGSFYPDSPVFHLGGISKMFGLADLKLGWIVLNDRALESYGARLEMLNDLFLGANQLSQSLVDLLLTAGRPFIQQMRDRLKNNLDFALRELSTTPRCTLTRPAGGAAIFPRIDSCVDDEEFALELLSLNTVVHPGYFYGSAVDTHLMLSLYPEEHTFREGLKQVVTLLRNQ